MVIIVFVVTRNQCSKFIVILLRYQFFNLLENLSLFMIFEPFQEYTAGDSTRCELPHPVEEVVLRRRDANESFYRCLVCGAGIRTRKRSKINIDFKPFMKF